MATRLDRRRVSGHLQAFGQLVRDARDEPAWTVIEDIAQVAREALGFQTVAVNRFRAGWDDFRVDVVLGSAPARDHLLGTTSPRAGWAQGVLVPRTAIGPGVHFFTSDPVDRWEHGGRAWVRRDAPLPTHDQHWSPLDTLLLALAGPAGQPVALLSFDDPHSGERPGTTEAVLLDLARRHLSLALQVADSTDRLAIHRGQLAAVEPACTRLAEARSRQEIWDELCSCMSSSMGWQRAALYERATPTHFVVAALQGTWPDGARAAVRGPVAADRAADLLGGAGMLAGGVLATTQRLRAPQSAAEERALLDGTPPVARAGVWGNDVLLFPMRSPLGELTAFLALERPADGQLPRPALRQHVSLVVERAQRAVDALPPVGGVPARWIT